MSDVVYRQLPDRQKRQYVYRRINGHLLLWRTDRAVALPMARDDAKALADWLWMRSIPRVRALESHGPTEPAGEYGTEETTP